MEFWIKSTYYLIHGRYLGKTLLCIYRWNEKKYTALNNSNKNLNFNFQFTLTYLTPKQLNQYSTKHTKHYVSLDNKRHYVDEYCCEQLIYVPLHNKTIKEPSHVLDHSLNYTKTNCLDPSTLIFIQLERTFKLPRQIANVVLRSEWVVFPLD